MMMISWRKKVLPSFILLLILLVVLFQLLTTSEAGAFSRTNNKKKNKKKNDNNSPPPPPPLYSPYRRNNQQEEGGGGECDIYLAPSPPRGWGVFAGRNFAKGEIVEITPRFLPLQTEFLHQNVLNDYHYAFRWEMTKPEDTTTFGLIAFGMTMFYNHYGRQEEQHNIEFQVLGREPDGFHPAMSLGRAYSARRNITRGEELFTTYGGEDWFTLRGLTMMEPKDSSTYSTASEELLTRREHQYCSKAVAGIGHPTWYRLMESHYHHYNQYRIPQIRNPHDYLPLRDHPIAVAKFRLEAGDVIEKAPALILPKSHVMDSFLEPLVMKWEDFNASQQHVIENLHKAGSFRLKAVNPQTGVAENDLLSSSSASSITIKDAVIFPVGGNIGLVQKVGRRRRHTKSSTTNSVDDDDDDNNSNKSNCRIELLSSSSENDGSSGNDVDVGSASLVLKLIATKSIQPGETLKLDMPDNSSYISKISLIQLLAITGQPIPPNLLLSLGEEDNDNGSGGEENFFFFDPPPDSRDSGMDSGSISGQQHHRGGGGVGAGTASAADEL